MSENSRVERVCMKIDPDWLVNIVRTLWLERNFAKAFNILNGIPELPVQDKLGILTGKRKIVYDNEEEGTLKVVEDDWVPDDAYEGMEVPTLEDVLKQAQIFTEKKGLYEALHEISCLAWAAKGIPRRGTVVRGATHASPMGYIRHEYVTELLCRIFDVPTQDEWSNFFTKYHDELKEIVPPPCKEEILVDKLVGEVKPPGPDERDRALAELWSPSTATNSEIFAAHDRVLYTRSCPSPDSTLESEDGWVLPNGKFYPCGYMEHIWLAEKLGSDEGKAELNGWVKISHGLDGRVYINRHHQAPEPTQKQINTVFDWCEKHKVKLPDWAGGRDD